MSCAVFRVWWACAVPLWPCGLLCLGLWLSPITHTLRMHWTHTSTWLAKDHTHCSDSLTLILVSTVITPWPLTGLRTEIMLYIIIQRLCLCLQGSSRASVLCRSGSEVKGVCNLDAVISPIMLSQWSLSEELHVTVHIAAHRWSTARWRCMPWGVCVCRI